MVVRYINNTPTDVLELTLYDKADFEELKRSSAIKSVCTSMEFAEYLPAFTSVESLILDPGSSSEAALNGIYSQHSIRSLVINYENDDCDPLYQIDLSRFSGLKYVFARHSGNITGVSESGSLRTLVVGNYAEDDFSLLQGSKIDSLCVLSGKIKSLYGSSRLPLRILSISNTPLSGVSALNDLQKLCFLELENCRKVSDMESLSSSSLEYLALLGNQRIGSLSFLSNLPQLKRIMLEWTVVDNDLSMLDGLEHAVVFTDKRGYNRKNKELPKAEKPYVFQDVPKWRSFLNNRKL
ncbi:MAG: hypothetical protein IJM85_02740 [Clostridia bacterium]|nr:hypothetical protein [Clostridia bacterium]